MKPQRPVLFICEDFPPDGGGLSAAAARISRLIGGGRKTDVVSFLRMNPDQPPRSDHEAETQNLAIHRFGPFTKGWAADRSWDGYTSKVITQAEQWICSSGLVQRETIVVGFGLKSAGILAASLQKKVGCPLIQCARGNDVSRNLFDVDRVASLYDSLSASDIVVAVNGQLSKLITSVFPDIGQRLVVIPNSISADFGAAANRLPPLGDPARGNYLLGYVGTMREQKNPGMISCLIDSVVEPRGGRFRIIGSFDETVLRQCGYGDIQLLSRKTVDFARAENPVALASIIAGIQVGVFPSIVEGLSNALLETAACGVPIVGTEAARELIEMVDERFICSPFRSAEFTEVVIELLSAASLRTEVGQKFRRVVDADFNPAKEAARWNSLLARVD